MSDELREKFTNNAEEFDSLMVIMLARNKELENALLEAADTISELEHDDWIEDNGYRAIAKGEKE